VRGSSRELALGDSASRERAPSAGHPPGPFCPSSIRYRSSPSRFGEPVSVPTPQAARGRARPPCRHFKTQSCCCLGSAFEFRLPNPRYSVSSSAAERRHPTGRERKGSTQIQEPDAGWGVVDRGGLSTSTPGKLVGDYDDVVIGGGIMGTSTAYEVSGELLAERQGRFRVRFGQGTTQECRPGIACVASGVHRHPLYMNMSLSFVNQ
jgi:hypothetical protein